MKQLYLQLNASAALSSIRYQAERGLPLATGEDRARLQRILAADSLDECYALIAEGLGDPDSAQAIRATHAARLSRQQAEQAALLDN